MFQFKSAWAPSVSTLAHIREDKLDLNSKQRWQTNLEIWQQAPGPTPECRQCHTEPRHAVCSPEKWTHGHMTHAAKLVNLQFEEIIKDITQSSGIFFICSMLMLLASLTFDLSHYLTLWMHALDMKRCAQYVGKWDQFVWLCFSFHLTVY